jgi:hypothetical protein
LKESGKKATAEQIAAAKAADDTATRQSAIAALQKQYAGAAEAYGNSAAGAQERFQVAVENLQESLGAKLLPVLTSVLGWITTNMPAMERIAGDVFGSIGGAIEKLRSVFQVNWPQIKAAGVAVLAWYRDNLQPTFISVTKNLSRAWENMTETMKRDAETNLGGGGGVSGTVKTKLEGMRSFANAILAAMRGDWSRAWAELKNGVRSNVEAMVTLWITAWTKILTTVRNINNALVNAVTAGINRVTGFVKAKFGQLIDWLAGLPGRVFSIGVAMGSSLVSGIVAGLSGLVSSVRDKIVGGIKGAISAAGGILHGSGDYMFTKQAVGEPMEKGISEGMMNGLSVLKAQVAPALKAIADKMEAQAKASAERMSRTFSAMSDRAMRAFEAIRGGISTPAEAALAAIADRRENEDLQSALASAIESGDAQAIARAQEDIQIKALQQQAENERRALDQQTEAMREKLTTKLEMMGKVWKGGTADILKLLEGFGVDFATVGSVLGTAFRQSLIASINGASTAAGGKGGVKNTAGAGSGSPIVTQVVLDGKVVAESVRNQNAIYQRANGLTAV